MHAAELPTYSLDVQREPFKNVRVRSSQGSEHLATCPFYRTSVKVGVGLFWYVSKSLGLVEFVFVRCFSYVPKGACLA